MIDTTIAYMVAAVLMGWGAASLVMRRNAVLLVIGVELMLAGVLVVLATLQAAGLGKGAGSMVGLFVIALAAAETVIALAVVIAVYTRSGSVDLDRPVAEPDELEGAE